MQSQGEQESRQPTYPKTLGQILDVLPLPENSDSMSSKQHGNLSTTGRAVANHAPIGKPLSETVLGSLRAIALSVNRGELMDDRALETLLVQSLGSSRFVSKPRRKHAYGAGGYDCQIEGYDITLDGLADCEMKLYDALQYLNRPASHAFVAKQVGRLQAVMARRSESNEDIAVVTDTYADHLAKYPPDIIATICWRIAENQKWFPLITDLVRECDGLMLFRRAVWDAMQEAKNPLLAPRAEAKRLAADPRLAMSYKELPRAEWLPIHYEWWIGDAENMAKMHREGSRPKEADIWQAESERRADEAARG